MLAARMLAETILFGAILLFVVRPLLKRWTRHVLAVEGTQISFTTLAIVLALVCASMIGMVNGLITVLFGVPSLIATLGMLFFLDGVLGLLG